MKEIWQASWEICIMCFIYPEEKNVNVSSQKELKHDNYFYKNSVCLSFMNCINERNRKHRL